MASIRKQGKAWQAIVRKKGYKTVSKFFPKKVLAEAWARKTEETLSQKLYLNTTAKETTVSQIMDRYRTELTPRKRSGDIEKYRIKTVINHLGEYTLEDLTPNAVIEFVDERRKVVSSDSVRKEINVLSLAVDASMALWDIDLPANPVHTARNILKVTKTLTPGNKRDRRPTQEELELLCDHAPGQIPEIILYAVETGMRRGEIADQRTEHRKGSTLLIPETKTDKPRTIPLSSKAIAILENLPVRDDGLVWGYTPSYISHTFCKVCRNLDIVDLRFHDLRHEAASRFFEMGLNIAEVAKITGQSFATLQRYTHLKAENIAKKLG